MLFSRALLFIMCSRPGSVARWPSTALGLISTWSHYPLVVAPFGASTVLLFGHPNSPLAQPRNIVLGNTLAAAVALLGVLLQDKPSFVLMPVLSGSVLLMAT